MEIEQHPNTSAEAKIGRLKYQTIVTSGGHTIVSDEPVADGGADTGMKPFGLLLASLASCTVITLRMYIDRKMWMVDEISVQLELFKSSEGVDIRSHLSFEGELTDDQRKRLITIANACPVHKLLVGKVAIHTALS